MAPQASQSLSPAAAEGFALVEEGTCQVTGTKSVLPVPACISTRTSPAWYVGGRFGAALGWLLKRVIALFLAFSLFSKGLLSKQAGNSTLAALVLGWRECFNVPD